MMLLIKGLMVSTVDRSDGESNQKFTKLKWLEGRCFSSVEFVGYGFLGGCVWTVLLNSC